MKMTYEIKKCTRTSSATIVCSFNSPPQNKSLIMFALEPLPNEKTQRNSSDMFTMSPHPALLTHKHDILDGMK